MAIHKVWRLTVDHLPLERPLKRAYSVRKHVGDETKDRQRKVTKSDSTVKVLGKLCPCCGVAGLVLCETETRIIYECCNGHQYETKKRLDLINNAYFANDFISRGHK
jgi:hypothetical protein